MKKKKKEKKFVSMEWMHIWDMHTFQCVDNEVYMGGTYWLDDGTKKDITLVFSNYQFLEWIGGNIEEMKEELINHIKNIDK